MSGKKTAIFALALALFAMTVLPACASSLWVGNSNLFADQKASGIGDIVLVNVVEEIEDSDEGKTKSNKKTDDNVNSGIGILDFIRAFGLGSASTFNSNTKIERTKELEMKLSCLVVDVMPNGNMVIQGDRILTSGAEKMTVRFSGVVRPQDVANNNIVQSNRVANAEIVVTGKGTVSRTQRTGIISQVLQAIF